METFHKLFGSLLLLYSLFCRIVIQGNPAVVIREEHIVHFFRDILACIRSQKEVLSRRTSEYKHWGRLSRGITTSRWNGPQKRSPEEDYAGLNSGTDCSDRNRRMACTFNFSRAWSGLSFPALNPKYACEIRTIGPIRNCFYGLLTCTSIFG